MVVVIVIVGVLVIVVVCAVVSAIAFKDVVAISRMCCCRCPYSDGCYGRCGSLWCYSH